MTKYSVEFKLKINQEYLQEKGGTVYLFKKYSVKSESQIGNWVNAYHEFGEEGLLRKRQHPVYFFQFKLDTIELYQTTCQGQFKNVGKGVRKFFWTFLTNISFLIPIIEWT